MEEAATLSPQKEKAESSRKTFRVPTSRTYGRDRWCVKARPAAGQKLIINTGGKKTTRNQSAKTRRGTISD